MMRARSQHGHERISLIGGRRTRLSRTGRMMVLTSCSAIGHCNISQESRHVLSVVHFSCGILASRAAFTVMACGWIRNGAALTGVIVGRRQRERLDDTRNGEEA